MLRQRWASASKGWSSTGRSRPVSPDLGYAKICKCYKYGMDNTLKFKCKCIQMYGNVWKCLNFFLHVLTFFGNVLTFAEIFHNKNTLMTLLVYPQPVGVGWNVRSNKEFYYKINFLFIHGMSYMLIWHVLIEMMWEDLWM